MTKQCCRKISHVCVIPSAPPKNYMTYCFLLTLLLRASVCLEPGQVSAAGVGQPPRHLLYRQSRQPYKSCLLLIVWVWVVLVILKPHPQYLSSLETRGKSTINNVIGMYLYQ